MWDGQSPRIGAAWKPPLASGLFDFKKNPGYFDIADRYPGAKNLGIELAQAATAGTLNLEAKLREYATPAPGIDPEPFEVDVLEDPLNGGLCVRDRWGLCHRLSPAHKAVEWAPSESYRS